MNGSQNGSENGTIARSPTSFREHLTSFGPGIVVVLTWLGAGDIVEVGVAGGLWWITACARYIGPTYRNRWWENLVMLVLFALAIWGAVGAVRSVAGIVFGNA